MLTDLKKKLSTNLFGFTKCDFVGRSIFSSRIPLTLVLIASGLLLMNTVNVQVYAIPITAFVLIDCKEGTEAGIINKLKTMQNVKEIYDVYGVHDIIVKVQANSQDQIKQTVTNGIRLIPHVDSTLTHVVK